MQTNNAMNILLHTPNWLAGWSLILAAFVSGAVVGLFFHREDFLGGYNSFRRRLLRLGHIACAALGILNLLVALGPIPHPLTSAGFIVGGITMPLICWLSAWRKRFRHLFFIPVVSLMAAVVLTIAAGHDGAHLSTSIEEPRSVVASDSKGGIP
jgi:hypothetical protein